MMMMMMKFFLWLKKEWNTFGRRYSWEVESYYNRKPMFVVAIIVLFFLLFTGIVTKGILPFIILVLAWLAGIVWETLNFLLSETPDKEKSND